MLDHLDRSLGSLADNKRQAAAALAAAVSQALGRHDTDHVAFCGCVDWHSCVHGTWALTAYRRMTGDRQYDDLLARVLLPDKIAAERDYVLARPEFEMPYGRAWFLRLAREQALGGNDALSPMADDILASLLAVYRARAPDPHRGSYRSDTWALINMADYAAWSGDAAASAEIRTLVQAHYIRESAAPGYDVESGHFMPVATNWAWLASKALPQAGLDPWCERFFAPIGLPQPVTAPVNWHHHGLNFSRCWGLWALAQASRAEPAKNAFLDAYIAHFRAGYDQPERWRGDYRGVGHWVPQFGMLALQGLFGTAQFHITSSTG